MKLVFSVQLPVEECQQRLQQAFSVRRKAFWGLFVEYGPVMGRIRGTKFFMYRIPRYRNLFFPFLFGTLEAGSNGTTVQANIQFPIASTVLTPFFLLISLLFLSNYILFPVSEQPSPTTQTISYLLIVVPSLVAVVIIIIGTMTYFDDGTYMENYLRQLLRAADSNSKQIS